MKPLYIAGAALKMVARDRKALALMILMPLILIAILGTALSGLMTGPEIPLDRFAVAVYVGDAGGAGGAFVTDVLQSELGEKLFDVTVVASPADVEAAVKAEAAYAGIVIPDDFGASLRPDGKAVLTVHGSARHELQTDIVRSIVDAYVEHVNAQLAALATAVPARAAAALAAPTPAVQQVPAGMRPVSAWQYYAAGMSVMFLLFTAVARGRNFITERQNQTLQRALLTPTGRGTVILGHYFAAVAVLFAQFLVIVALTRLLFGVTWGEPFWLALVVGFCFSLAGGGLAMLVAAFARTPQVADAIGNVGVQLLAAIGGSQVPLYVFPKFLRTVGNWTPNGKTLTALTDLMAGRTATLPGAVALLVGVGVLGAAAAAWRLTAAREV